jgi:hypothetical protein
MCVFVFNYFITSLLLGKSKSRLEIFVLRIFVFFGHQMDDGSLFNFQIQSWFLFNQGQLLVCFLLV